MIKTIKTSSLHLGTLSSSVFIKRAADLKRTLARRCLQKSTYKRSAEPCDLLEGMNQALLLGRAQVITSPFPVFEDSWSEGCLFQSQSVQASKEAGICLVLNKKRQKSKKYALVSAVFTETEL